MNTQKQGKKPVMDAIWDEMTSVWPPLPKAELMQGKPDLVPSFGGRVSSVSFRRKHPFEHHLTPDEPHITTDDWTVPHD
jgi:hypothetical protein